MNEVQEKLDTLKKKGWTWASIATELGQTTNTVEKWKAGQHKPANIRLTLAALALLAKRKRIPPQRRYRKGSRRAQKASVRIQLRE